MNGYEIKWLIYLSVLGRGFNRQYKSALRKNGFTQIGHGGDIFGLCYNSKNQSSVDRMKTCFTNFRAKEDSYKKGRQGYLHFSITDKQFGLIGTDKFKPYCSPASSLGRIPVTKKQLYETAS